MKYLEFTFHTTPSNEAISDVLSATLAEIGFESFVDTAQLEQVATGVQNDFPEAPVFAESTEQGEYKAYIQAQLFDAEALQTALDDFPLPGIDLQYEMTEAEDKNWNEEWEKNYFQPLIIGSEQHPRCVVASTFHQNVPTADYNIWINPQMSFGTGHHQTTHQMMERILDDEMQGKVVLDMGCGTSILAILARMRGAVQCVAVDYDEWCVRNSIENIALNQLNHIEVLHGDASVLAPLENRFDLIIANINRNILIQDLERYVPTLRSGGHIYMSGFYTADVPALRSHAETLGLVWEDQREREGWACIKMYKA